MNYTLKELQQRVNGTQLMTKQITLKEALELVDFKKDLAGHWGIEKVKTAVYGDVDGNVRGNVLGNVIGDVRGDVYGDVDGNVLGDVRGYIFGTIKGRNWEFTETPIEKLRRLIEEGADKEQLIESVDQLENNS